MRERSEQTRRRFSNRSKFATHTEHFITVTLQDSPYAFLLVAMGMLKMRDRGGNARPENARNDEFEQSIIHKYTVSQKRPPFIFLNNSIKN